MCGRRSPTAASAASAAPEEAAAAVAPAAAEQPSAGWETRCAESSGCSSAASSPSCLPGAGASGASAAGAAGRRGSAGWGLQLRGRLLRGRRGRGVLGRAPDPGAHAGLLPGLLRCNGPVGPAIQLQLGRLHLLLRDLWLPVLLHIENRRLNQSTCTNYDTPLWLNIGKPPARQDDSPHHLTKDKTNLIVYIICWVVAVMAPLGIFTKLGLDKAHRPQMEHTSRRAAFSPRRRLPSRRRSLSASLSTFPWAMGFPHPPASPLGEVARETSFGSECGEGTLGSAQVTDMRNSFSFHRKAPPCHQLLLVTYAFVASQKRPV